MSAHQLMSNVTSSLDTGEHDTATSNLQLCTLNTPTHRGQNHDHISSSVLVSYRVESSASLAPPGKLLKTPFP